MKHVSRKLFILFSTLVISVSITAQKFDFRNYSVINGMGSSSVNHIFQDSKGYIWFATQGGGASRFNGREFKNFTKADGLICNDVTFITEDKRGNIWIATAQGASVYDGVKFINYGSRQGLTDDVVYADYADADGKIWFATKDRGIKIFNGQIFDSLTVKNGLPSNEAYSINKDRNGRYWFGLSNGIASYDGKSIISYNNLNFVKNRSFFSIAADSSGNIWFGAASGEVVVIRPGKEPQPFVLPANLNKFFIGGIAADKQGKLWLATDHGVIEHSNEGFRLFTEKEGLSVNSAQTVICDYEGNIWIGTLGGGADMLSSEAFASYAQSEGLGSNNVTCLYEDTLAHVLYAGTGGAGLYFFGPGNNPAFKPLTGIPEIRDVNIASIGADSKGLLWLCAQEGVFVLEKKDGSFHLKRRYKSIAGQNLVTPLQAIDDGRGNEWLITFGSGLFTISGAKEKCYSSVNGFQSDNILCAFQDRHSNIWLGTLDAGIIKYDGISFSNFRPKENFPAKAVWSIAEDSQGNMYFGTGENGLYCYDGTSLSHYTVRNGLCSNYISALQWDARADCLWTGAEQGVNKIKFDGKHSIAAIHTYDESKGYNSWGINQNSILASGNGKIWFGSVNGLWRYDGDYDLPKTTPPKIQLTDVRLAYRKTNWKKYCDSVDSHTGLPVNLNLSYKNNHLTFDINALTTDKVFYTYRLEGQDEDWSPLTQNSEANFSNISPGKNYLFRARAVNSSGIYSADVIAFPFSIALPWWSAWWFRATVLSAVFIGIIIVVKTRENVLRAQTVKLEKTVTERTAEVVEQKKVLEQLNIEKNNFLGIVTHDLKNPLGIVRTFAEISSDPQTAPEKRERYLQNIAIATDRMYELVNNLLDIHSIEAGKLNLSFSEVSLNELVQQLAEQVEEVAKKRNIRLMVQLPDKNISLQTDKARLSQVLQNYISNALKYSPGDSTVRISLSEESECIELKVKDEGPGIAPEEQALLFSLYGTASSAPLYGENKTGLGLAIVKRIADELNAETGCHSVKGAGSEFYIRFAKTSSGENISEKIGSKNINLQA